MAFFKELITVWILVAAVAAYHPTPYAKEPSYHHQPNKVKLHKLCSWNVVKYDEYAARELYRDDSYDACKVDAGRAHIPENNIPNGFDISDDGRMFVVSPRDRLGVYSNLGYFHLNDIGPDEQCPELKPYPPHINHTLNAQCCTEGNLMNVNRITIDSCQRLWAVDRQAMGLNDKAWEHFSPKLVIYDLKTDREVRNVKLPKDAYSNWQLGLKDITVNVDPHDCNKAYAYILDAYNGCIVVYSFHENKFWRACSPEFALDAKYSKFHVKTRKGKEVTYYKDDFITTCTRDLKNQQLVCHSNSQLDEYTVPFEDLNNEANAKCSPESLNVKYLGQKCKKCQVNMHSMNKETQVVWGIQEQNYGVSCWNRENPLTPEAVTLVVQDHHRMPFLTDLRRTDADLSYFRDHYDDYHRREHYNSYSHKDEYVVVLSNNYQSIYNYGLDDYEENFGFYFFSQKEAVQAYPQCLAYEKPAHYQPSHYQPPSYKPSQPSYKPAQPQYVPHPPPTYQPPAEYKPPVKYAEATYQPQTPAYKPPTEYKPPVKYVQPSYQHPAPPRYKKSEESNVDAVESKQE